jgi:hypothetical protein
MTTSPSTTTGIFGVPITPIVPTVTGGSGITYSISPTLPAGLSLNANGTVSGTPTETSTVKTYTQTAVVTGSSGSSTFALSVINANSSISTPTVTPVSPTVGSAITFTSTVTSNTQETLTGTISFRNSLNTLLCSTSSLSTGIGSCSFTPVTTDTFTVSAFYSGMTFVDSSTSLSTLTLTPSKGNPTATLTGSVSRLLLGQSVTLTMTLVPGTITNATGSVAYTTNTNAITGCSTVTPSSNIATCSFTPTTAGVHEIVATYSGDSNYNGVVASAINVTVSSCTQSVSGTLTVNTGAPAAGYCAVAVTANSGSLGLPVNVISMTSRIMIIGGGGSGGTRAGAGGGAGAILYSSAFAISDTNTVQIGEGGRGLLATNHGESGTASTFGNYTALAGGGGANNVQTVGYTGGSGGGGAGPSGGTAGGASQSTFGGIFTAYVKSGGIGTSGSTGPAWTGGGGGGAGDVGGAGIASTRGAIGGPGRAFDMTLNGAFACFAAGGGGGAGYPTVGGAGGSCTGNSTAKVGGDGSGGGISPDATAGAANTGSGGGGSGFGVSGNDQVDTGRSGAGGSGLVALRYISPATITVPIDATTASLTTVTLVATAPLFTNLFTRTYQWQKFVGATWSNETSTSATTLIFTFVPRFGEGATQRFRLLVTDSDGTLFTTTASRTITLTVTPLTQPTLFLGSTYGVAGTSLSLFTIGGAGSGATSYASVSQGSAAGCSLTGTTISLATTGVCRVVATKAADLDYLVKFSETSTVTFVVFEIVVQAPPTNTSTGIQTSGTTTPTKGSNACVTGCVPSIASISVLSARAGELVVLTGLSFSQVNKVYFRLDTTTATSDVEAANLVIDSDTQISVRVPAGLVAGEFYTIRVATPDKTSARFYDIEILP